MDSYETEYKALASSAGRSLVLSMAVADQPAISTADDATARIKHVHAAADAIDEAFALVQSMELETHTLPKAKRAEVDARIQGYKVDISRMRQELRTARLAATKASESSSRAELFGLDPDDDTDPAVKRALEARGKMLDSTQRMQQSTERIQASRMVAAETENTGAALLMDLHDQSQTIARTRDNLAGMDGVLGRGRSYLDSMTRRNMMNRLVLNGLGACIILGCIAVLVLRLTRDG